MKLQKHLAYKYKDKKYYKHVLTIPLNIMKELGWKPGERLDQVIENGILVIRPNRQVTQRIEKTKNLPIKKTEKIKGE